MFKKNFWYIIISLLTATLFLTVFFNAQKTQASLDDSLVGYWKFDENTGTTSTDSSVTENDGTLYNAPSWVTGVSGSALQFNGTSSYAQISSNAAYSDMGSSGAVSLWFKADTLDANWHLLFTHQLADHFYIGHNSSNLKFYINEGTQRQVQLIFTNTWYHVVMTWDGSNIKGYVNGAEALSGTYSTDDFNEVTGGFLIGTSNGTEEFFDGAIDEVRVYGRNLTAAEVTEIYDTERQTDTTPPSDPANLQATAASSTQVNLTWTASAGDNVELKGYKIYRNGVRIASYYSATSTETYVDVLNLSPSTNYTYTVTAYDLGANESSHSNSASVTTLTDDSGLSVFPGAQGFGVKTVAGRGGTVYKVTNLNPSGSGSLQECVEASGARVCIFEVGGIIDLNSASLTIDNPYITVAGQTAPSPGITIKSGTLDISTHDVLIQHIRFRYGDLTAHDNDSIAVYDATAGEANNIVIDHCSASWSIDENIGIGIGGSKITVSNSIISEALENSHHAKGAHSMGMLIGGRDNQVAVINNLFAHNDQRQPLINASSTVLVVNNVIYNPQQSAIHFAGSSGSSTISVVGNKLVKGAANENFETIIYIPSNFGTNPRVFALDNSCKLTTDNPWTCVTDNVSTSSIRTYTPPTWECPLTVRLSSEVQSYVLSNAGARPADRDSVDTRIVNDVTNGTGSLIDSQDDVGGWPSFTTTTHSLTLPDNYNSDDDGDGYTNLEELLHRYAEWVEGRDSTAPTRPANLQASPVSPSQVDLSWSASTDSVGVLEGYKIYRDGTYIAATSAASYSDTGLNPLSFHSYLVTAYDKSGNESSQASISVSTLLSIITISGPIYYAAPQPPSEADKSKTEENSKNIPLNIEGVKSNGKKAAVVSDSLIKGGVSAVYYYASDRKRYVFPNEKTFYSWFSNFNEVITISDSDLAQLSIGGAVTYKPGARMVKFQTDPAVYAVEKGGKLRWIKTTALAQELYGKNWNKKIDDISDAFFANYKMGEPIIDFAGYDTEAIFSKVTTINEDKFLK